MDEKNWMAFAKQLKEDLYQKKVCLKKIHDICIDAGSSPDERVEKVIEVCILAGVYIERGT